MRTALSRTPIVNSSEKPPRLLLTFLLLLVSRIGVWPSAGADIRIPMASATTIPSIASTQSTLRHGISVNRTEVAAGTAAFPRSPVKL
jgi:hypothetical protein